MIPHSVSVLHSHTHTHTFKRGAKVIRTPGRFEGSSPPG